MARRPARHALCPAALAAATLFLTGCSSVFEGVSQTISIRTEPAGAACVLFSNNKVIARVAQTPGSVQLGKSKYDILIRCSKGEWNGEIVNFSDYAVSGIGNIVLGPAAIVGGWVDSATGASSKYDTAVYLRLEKRKRGKNWKSCL